MSVCPIHGLSSCRLTNIYQPFFEDKDVIDDPYMFIASWNCKKCDRKGLAGLKDIYDSITDKNNVHNTSGTLSTREILKSVSKKMVVETQSNTDKKTTQDDKLPPLSHSNSKVKY